MFAHIANYFLQFNWEFCNKFGCLNIIGPLVLFSWSICNWQIAAVIFCKLTYFHIWSSYFLFFNIHLNDLNIKGEGYILVKGAIKQSWILLCQFLLFTHTVFLHLRMEIRFLKTNKQKTAEGIELVASKAIGVLNNREKSPGKCYILVVRILGSHRKLYKGASWDTWIKWE